MMMIKKSRLIKQEYETEAQLEAEDRTKDAEARLLPARQRRLQSLLAEASAEASEADSVAASVEDSAEDSEAEDRVVVLRIKVAFSAEMITRPHGARTGATWTPTSTSSTAWRPRASPSACALCASSRATPPSSAR